MLRSVTRSRANVIALELDPSRIALSQLIPRVFPECKSELSDSKIGDSAPRRPDRVPPGHRDSSVEVDRDPTVLTSSDGRVVHPLRRTHNRFNGLVEFRTSTKWLDAS